jgi:muramoyltetrapeptide carboxypeptidase
MSSPIFLVPPKTLGLCSPAGPVDQESISPAINKLRKFGYEVVFSPNAFEKKGYLAGDDDVRLHDFLDLILAPAIDAVVALRGGYGSLRLLPLIEDWDSWPKNKPIVGFSDITAIHLARWAKTGVGGWHAPVINSLNNQPIFLSFSKTMSGNGATSWAFKPGSCIRKGEGCGHLLGGNLVTINSMLESDYLPSFDGAIVLLEETGEAQRRLDRLFTTLILSGRLKNIQGLVLGSFHQCGVPSEVRKALDSLSSLAGRFPIVKNAPFGHHKLNYPWWYGKKSTLTVNQDGAELNFESDG